MLIQTFSKTYYTLKNIQLLYYSNEQTSIGTIQTVQVVLYREKALLVSRGERVVLGLPFLLCIYFFTGSFFEKLFFIFYYVLGFLCKCIVLL